MAASETARRTGRGVSTATDATGAAGYLRDPDEIYAESFRMIRAETDLSGVPADLEALVLRLVHASGMPDIVADLAWSAGAAGATSATGAGAAGRAALAAGAPILCDVGMVARGVIRARLPAANPVICTLDDPEVPARARAAGITRSAAAVELWPGRLAGAVVAIGNAPTALFRLLELLAAEPSVRPALVLGFPVGFVGAVESKAALAASDLPFVTLHGRRGGSAMAAAAVNALAGPADLTEAAT